MLIVYNPAKIEIQIAGHHVVNCVAWEELITRVPRASAAILMLLRLDDEALDGTRSLRGALPVTPIILVTAFDPENVRRLAKIRVEQVVWGHEIGTGLSAAIAEALRCQVVLDRLTSAIEEEPDLNAALKQEVLLAFRADPPFRTVKRWAHSADRTPRAIQKLWRSEIGCGAASPREFLKKVRRVRNALAAGSDTDLRVEEECLLSLLRRSGADDVSPG
jgi:hypothetical protein